MTTNNDGQKQLTSQELVVWWIPILCNYLLYYKVGPLA